jgi:Tfp pilus assembly protein PilN
MAMINLLSPEQKRNIRAARTNVMLVRYCVMLAFLGALVGAVYATGFWLVHSDEQTVDSRLASQADRTKVYAAVEKQADEFRDNLAVAKSILSKETSYSDFLITLARYVPSGTVLTSLTVGDSSAASTSSIKKAAVISINARATSYAKVLELKNSLEQSPLFEDVNIVSATTQDNSSTTGTEALYPFTTTLNVKLSTQSSSGDNS